MTSTQQNKGSVRRTQDMMNAEQRAAYFQSRLQENLGRVKSVTTPIYVNDPPRHVGSGVLLRVGDRFFLLTAAHVGDYRLKGLLYLGSATQPVQILGEITHTTPPANGRDSDVIDAAVIHLADQTTEHLSEDEFLSVDELDAERLPRFDDYFLVAGYPFTKQEFQPEIARIDAYLYPFVGVSKSAADYARSKRNADEHLIIGFTKKKMWRPDTGRLIAPDLYGMSGGGTWWLENYAEEHCSMPRLSAISLEWRLGNRSEVVGTRVPVFLGSIHARFPELRPYLPV